MSTKYKFINPAGVYVVSFAVVNWINIFNQIVYIQIIIDCLKFCQKNKGLRLHAWVLMKNHMHLIFSCNDDVKHSDIMRDFKKFTSTRIVSAIKNNPLESKKEWILNQLTLAGTKNSNNKNFQFWRQDNHPMEIFSPKIIAQKLNYLHLNPVKAGYVKSPEQYLYSSASAYCGQESLLEVEILDLPLSDVGYIYNS